jgi:large subunit ribosomal protein L6
MSRIGKQPVAVPPGVDVTIDGSEVTVKGPKGVLNEHFHIDMIVSRDNAHLTVSRPSDEREHRALHGLTRSLLANMVRGVSEGFTKTIDLVGVGYRAQQAGKGITLSVMLSHPVEIQPLDNVTLEVEGNNRIMVSGISKQAVGQMAAEIRAVRPPNVYTGKGIRYAGEQIKLKPGKSARSAEV